MTRDIILVNIYIFAYICIYIFMSILIKIQIHLFDPEIFVRIGVTNVSRLGSLRIPRNCFIKTLTSIPSTFFY